MDAIIDQLSVFDWANNAANDNMPDGGSNILLFTPPTKRYSGIDSENDGSFLMLPVVMAYRNLMGNGKWR